MMEKLGYKYAVQSEQYRQRCWSSRVQTAKPPYIGYKKVHLSVSICILFDGSEFLECKIEMGGLMIESKPSPSPGLRFNAPNCRQGLPHIHSMPDVPSGMTIGIVRGSASGLTSPEGRSENMVGGKAEIWAAGIGHMLRHAINYLEERCILSPFLCKRWRSSAMWRLETTLANH